MASATLIINNLSDTNNDIKSSNNYNPYNINTSKENTTEVNSLSININSVDNIFTFICSEKNNKNTNNILNAIYKLENKVRYNIKKREIKNISSAYTSFNFDLSWIDIEYKKLIIKQISEDLITKNILDIFKK
jgi:hypothetical protein